MLIWVMKIVDNSSLHNLFMRNPKSVQAYAMMIILMI